MPKKKIKKNGAKNVKSPLGIKPSSITNPQGISFSYKFFQSDHSKFSIEHTGAEYTKAVFERLKALSSWNYQELITNRSSSLRCHSIDWDYTTEPCFGFPDEEQLVETPYQFSISANAHGRVHGFFIEEVFYVVWLDPDHKLYSKGG